ncbi:phosphoribosylpyrophosphate synthetase [Pedobacter sp. W3I1]|uniref:phosphoribosylpyrophosphate synthetase n=1 Tax=Pedobacter sp. W3I1 TaxID=3042291 RepID=UPI0027D827E6|nr:phosphoribosylpyrophosphate synthetase [Pedobacter sp. W3I1]
MDNDYLKHIGEMTSLSEVVNALAEQGYIVDFNLKSSQINDGENPIQEFPEQFLIDRHYRFEGESDPDDEAIVYAISSIDGKIKGIFVNGYGTSSESAGDEVINQLKSRTD